MTADLKVPFLDLRATYLELQSDIDAAVARVLASGWYILGAECETFEHAFADYCGAKYCVGVANGLEALELALIAGGVRPGDEVLVPSNTYIATWLAVSHVGARPVPIEPDPATHNLDPRALSAAITPRTTAVLPVHLYGMPADLTAIERVAKAHGLFMLDDAAQAHGARHSGRPIGGLADATAWSFYPGKNLGAYGDAGAITTNDSALAEKLRTLRNYGSKIKYHNEIIGYNSRLDPIQAAVLNVKLNHLDNWNQRRRAVARHYAATLRECAWLNLPLSGDESNTPSLHLYVVQTDTRTSLQEHLTKHGIQTLIHYPVPPHAQPAYRELGIRVGALPISEKLANRVLSLPIGPHMSDAEVAYTCRTLMDYRPAPEPVTHRDVS